MDNSSTETASATAHSPGTFRTSPKSRANSALRQMSRCIPSGMFRVISLCANYMYDARRFHRYTRSRQPMHQRVRRKAEITMLSHGLEKGMSLPNPRPFFGAAKVEELLRLCRIYIEECGYDLTIGIASHCLLAYKEFHGPGHAHPVLSTIEDFLATYSEPASEITRSHGGVQVINRNDQLVTIRMEPEKFFLTRHSVRHFSSEPVSEDVLRRAIRLAQETPSVCNRQSYRVHMILNRGLIQRCLELQACAVGFEATVDKLAICTADVRSMVSVAERNQPFIDGALFSMSLMYAFHALGVGTCALNWSRTRGEDRLLRKLVPIPDYESIIMLLAIGNLPAVYRVAKSARIDLDDVARFHQ